MKSKVKPNDEHDREIIYGMQNIGAYLGISRPTLQRWRDKHGFPVCLAPNGRYMTSTALVDQWIIARKALQKAKTEL